MATRWSIAINNYYFTGSIVLETASWYIFAIENIIQIICSYIPRIPLPKSIKIKRDDEIYTLREWYGDVQQMFYSHVFMKVSEWCYKRIDFQYISFPFNMLKEQFPEYFLDMEDFQFPEKEIEDNRVYAESIEKKFKTIYKKLENICEHRKKNYAD